MTPEDISPGQTIRFPRSGFKSNARTYRITVEVIDVYGQTERTIGFLGQRITRNAKGETVRRRRSYVIDLDCPVEIAVAS